MITDPLEFAKNALVGKKFIIAMVDANGETSLHLSPEATVMEITWMIRCLEEFSREIMSEDD